MSFALVTDSTCDLAPEVAEKLGIHIVPLRVKVGGQSYLDWLEIDPEQFYEHMRQGAYPVTSPPSVRRFSELYRKLLEDHDFVVSVHISAPMSQTLQHARQAVVAERLGARVLVIDSGMTSVGLADSVLAIREMLLAGGDADAAQMMAQQVRRDSYCQFTVSSLEYLRNGGRLSRSQEVLGNLLGMRPVLGFEDGHIRVDRTVRQDRVLPDLVNAFEKHFGDEPLSVAVAHAGRDPERMQMLREAIEKSRLNIAYRRIQLVGAVIGAHGGPGFYGINAVPASTIERAIKTMRSGRLTGAERRIGRH